MRRLILLAFIGAFLTDVYAYPSSLAWLFGVKNKLHEIKEETQTVCQTHECKKMAKIILNSMNKSVDPCDDFYEYACGEYPIHNPLPKGHHQWGLFYSLQMKVKRQIEEILDAGPKDDDLFAVKLAKKWYKSCMDTDAMEKQGLDPLISTISRIGGWPIIMHPDEWDEQEYSWQKVDDQYMRLTGRNTFHDVRAEETYGKNGTTEKIVILVDTPHLPPVSYKLYFGSGYDDSDEEESDEDSSDEEKQSHEGGNDREPWSEGDDDSKHNKDDHNDDDDEDGSDDDSKHNEDDYNNDDDDEDDDDDRDNNENSDENSVSNEISDDDTNEHDKDKRAKKKIDKRKTAGKIGHKRKRKLGHGGHKKSNVRIIDRRNSNRKAKQQRTRRRATPTKINNKRAQHSSQHHREGLHPRKSKGNHARRIHRQRDKKTANNAKEAHTTIKPHVTTEETEVEVAMEILKEYADYISKIARAIADARGIEVSKEHIDKDIKDMILFQLELLEIVMESGEMLELTLAEFQTWYDKRKPKTANSKIDWSYKIEELFDEAHVSIDDDLGLDIEVHSPDYFKALVKLLDETPSRTIVNYIHWNFISRIIKTTTNELREMYDQWEDDDDEDKTRSAICIDEVKISDILSYEYVRNHFSDNTTETAMDMLDDIQKEVEYQIKESDWMDDDTKDFVLAKLVKMQKLIGYPNWYTNSTIVKRYFQGLIIGMSYYENTLSYDRYAKWKELRKLKVDFNNEEIDILSILEIDASEVNAFYIPQVNFLTITAADFQSPFFAYNRPDAINFGIIGFMMAHEVNHGFDDTGHLYDKNGKEIGWLSAMAQAYGERTECFVEQFNNYPIDKASNKKIKNYGNQTTSDNIADTMGLQAVFRAYRRRERECGKQEIALPGLENITNDQLFFLSFANIWCEAIDPDYVMALAKLDEHSPGRLRVIGSVSNSEEFAKAYNCPTDSPMNPEKKCSIWK